jgi:predicted nucleotidyltransferase
LPGLVSLELENSFQEQMKVKNYLEKILENKINI